MAGVNLNVAHALRAEDANGDAVSGSKLTVYEAGTTTAVTTYSDSALTTANASPVVADSSGSWGPIYVPAGLYKIDVTDSGGTSLPGYPEDNISVPNAAGALGLDTRADITTIRIAASVDAIRTSGYAAVGDGGGALYKRVGAEPSHAFKVQSADGAWWEGVPEAGWVNADALNGNVQDALDTGHSVRLSGKDYAITGDLTITTEGQALIGTGEKSKLVFTDGGLVWDATGLGDHLSYVSVGHLAITRSGTAGPAFSIKGSAANPTDVIRWTVGPIWIESSTGDGVYIEESYLGNFRSPYVRNCSAKAWHLIGANAISIFGGETQANAEAGLVSDCQQVSFFGHTMQGNTEGMVIGNSTENFNFIGGYLENNATGNANGYDFQLGNGSGSAEQAYIAGNYMKLATAQTRTTGAIRWVSAVGCNVENNWMATYAGGAHDVSGATFLHENTIRANRLPNGEPIFTAEPGVNSDFFEKINVGDVMTYRRTLSVGTVDGTTGDTLTLGVNPTQGADVTTNSTAIIVRGSSSKDVKQHAEITSTNVLTLTSDSLTGSNVDLSANEDYVFEIRRR